MFRSARAIALVLVAAAGSVAAQQVGDADKLGRLDARTRVAVSAILDTVRMQRLPVEPLIDKALEGAAKKAPSQLIIAAVRTYWGQLGEARRALGESSSQPELVGGAQAIRAGIPLQRLELLRKARQNVQIATALNVVSDLVTREVPIDTAVTVVSSLLGAQVSDDQLLQMRSDIEAAILSGQPPAVAASARAHALGETLAAGLPNGAGNDGALPSPRGNRAGDGSGIGKPPSSASAGVSVTPKPPVQRKPRP